MNLSTMEIAVYNGECKTVKPQTFDYTVRSFQTSKGHSCETNMWCILCYLLTCPIVLTTVMNVNKVEVKG